MADHDPSHARIPGAAAKAGTPPGAVGRPAPLTVLLDIDGTLLDSNDAHARAWVEVMRRAGRSLAFDAVRPMIGKGGDKVFAELLGIDPESKEAERITEVLTFPPYSVEQRWMDAHPARFTKLAGGRDWGLYKRIIPRASAL